MPRLLALLLVLLTAACTTQPGPPPPPAPITATPPPALQLDSALPTEPVLKAAGFKRIGGYADVVEAENDKHRLLLSCERSPSDKRIDHSGRVAWHSDDRGAYLLALTVAHYRDGKAAEAITDVRTQLACGRFSDGTETWPDGSPTLSEPQTLEMPPLPGMAAQHSACGRSGRSFHGCVLVVAKGDLAVASVIRGTDAAAVAAGQRRVAPLVAEALSRA